MIKSGDPDQVPDLGVFLFLGKKGGPAGEGKIKNVTPLFIFSFKGFLA